MCCVSTDLAASSQQFIGNMVDSFDDRFEETSSNKFRTELMMSCGPASKS